MSSSNKIRLQKRMAESGVASRRASEKLIEEGKVQVNGQLVTELGYKVTPEDIIEVEGKRLFQEEQKVYYLLNKPKGIISSAKDTHQRKVVTDLIDTNYRIFPVGRLDKETTGALLLTNDGEFTNRLTHPRYDLSKEYHVSVQGKLTKDTIYKLERGITIDGVSYQGVKINNARYDGAKNRTQFDITLFEGKNRQIRKLMEHFHIPVQKLHRFKIGTLVMDDLKIGEYRSLTAKEVKQLLKETKED